MHHFILWTRRSFHFILQTFINTTGKIYVTYGIFSGVIVLNGRYSFTMGLELKEYQVWSYWKEISTPGNLGGVREISSAEIACSVMGRTSFYVGKFTYTYRRYFQAGVSTG